MVLYYPHVTERKKNETLLEQWPKYLVLMEGPYSGVRSF